MSAQRVHVETHACARTPLPPLPPSPRLPPLRVHAFGAYDLHPNTCTHAHVRSGKPPWR